MSKQIAYLIYNYMYISEKFFRTVMTLFFMEDARRDGFLNIIIINFIFIKVGFHICKLHVFYS